MNAIYYRVATFLIATTADESIQAFGIWRGGEEVSFSVIENDPARAVGTALKHYKFTTSAQALAHFEKLCAAAAVPA